MSVEELVEDGARERQWTVYQCGGRIMASYLRVPGGTLWKTYDGKRSDVCFAPDPTRP